MSKARFVSYLRVSTARQGASGLGLEAQRAAVESYVSAGDWQLVREFVEVESGKKNDRPALAAALRLCRQQRATLVIAKLDRLARNVAFIANLMEAGVEFVAVDMPTANRLTVHILAAVAEDEAKRISDRTKSALKAAKARGTPLGGRRVSPRRFAAIASQGREASSAARTAKAAKLREEMMPVIRDVQACGTVSLRGIAAELNDRGYSTQRGSEWNSVQVFRLLRDARAA